MTRKIAVVVALAAALLAAFIWLSLRDDPMQSETPAPLEGVGGGDAALMEDAQSPVQPQEASAADGEAPSANSGAAKLDTGPYQFEGWEDAANHFAELVGLRYDELIAAGVDPGKAESQAFHEVQDEIFIGREDPALAAALDQYIPYGKGVPMEERTEERMPAEEYGPTEFLVRAGRLPPLALKAGSLSLPNGERYHFDKDEEVVVIWQVRYVPADTEWGQQELARMEKDYAEWETKLTHDPENTEALGAIAALQTMMADLRTPRLKNRKKERRVVSHEEIKRRMAEPSAQRQGQKTKYKPEDFQPSRPDLRLTVFDLGVIDE